MKNKERKGFTLVELLVVIAILAILATVSIIGYTSFTKKAYISNDTTLVAQLNEQLRLYEVENDKITKESQINEIIKQCDCFELIPKSARYGYHIWFDIKQHCFILAKIDEEPIDETSLNIINQIKELFDNEKTFADEIEEEIIGSNKITDNVFRTVIKENCYLVDKGGSNLAEALTILDNPKDGEEYLKAVELVYGLIDDSNDSSSYEPLEKAINNTVIFGKNGTFEPEVHTGDAADAKVYFTDGITVICAQHYTFTHVEEGFAIDEKTQNIHSKITTIVIPETVSEVQLNSMNFENGTEVTLVLSENKIIKDLFSANSTNALIKQTKGEETEYFVIKGTEVLSSDESGTNGEKVFDLQYTKGAIKVALENADAYLYRVGNLNSVPINLLFKFQNATEGNVKGITFTTLAGNASALENEGNISFTGVGLIKLQVANAELLLEVLNGVNYAIDSNNKIITGKYNNNQATLDTTSRNTILLSDAYTTSINIKNGNTLYGNGFKITDARNHPYTQIGCVEIDDGTMDNVSVIGYEASGRSFFWTSSDADYAPIVSITNNGGNVFNSYISGGRFALEVSADAIIKNTTIDGGAIGNASFSSGNILMENCITTSSTRGNSLKSLVFLLLIQVGCI